MPKIRKTKPSLAKHRTVTLIGGPFAHQKLKISGDDTLVFRTHKRDYGYYHAEHDIAKEETL